LEEGYPQGPNINETEKRFLILRCVTNPWGKRGGGPAKKGGIRVKSGVQKARKVC